MITKIDKNQDRLKRHARVRKKISGTPACPRLSVYRSLNNMYVQLIDDTKGVTLAAASTLELKDSFGGNKTAASEVGKLIEKGIKTVVFDRSGYIYHGRVKEVADGAREAGLEF